ncbi:hypothetical protein HPB49_002302 [Dermacentor silvarum]|uniref:Uncharacterized protein n=1 Tax=Dermacentor silvarum TaxID=543639 RepID=A0ACB8DM62_DERSI|nr:hypothetical protein HPB49_002302 [Dermacentor silvarum]
MLIVFHIVDDSGAEGMSVVESSSWAPTPRTVGRKLRRVGACAHRSAKEEGFAPASPGGRGETGTSLGKTGEDAGSGGTRTGKKVQGKKRETRGGRTKLLPEERQRKGEKEKKAETRLGKDDDSVRGSTASPGNASFLRSRVIRTPTESLFRVGAASAYHGGRHLGPCVRHRKRRGFFLDNLDDIRARSGTSPTGYQRWSAGALRGVAGTRSTLEDEPKGPGTTGRTLQFVVDLCVEVGTERETYNMADHLIYKVTGFIQKARSYMPGACGEENSGEQLHFAKQGNDTELSNFQGIGTGSGEGGEYAETSLTEGVNGLAPQRSVDVVDEFGGREGEKISEWQAGWNVTNAIQVHTRASVTRDVRRLVHAMFSDLCVWSHRSQKARPIRMAGQFPEHESASQTKSGGATKSTATVAVACKTVETVLPQHRKL